MALHALGAGRLQTVGITGQDEIGELGRAFDHMAAELQMSFQKRVEVEAALQHHAGDRLLQEVARRLESECSGTEMHSLPLVGASVGIALYPDHGQDVPTLMRRADIAVNLSGHDVQNPSLPELIAKQLASVGLPASSLTVQLTETALMADPERALRTLERLGAMGVEIAIDDFGTGYSSLSYLTRLPVDQLKIDRSFVGDRADQTRESAVVRSTVDLGHTLGLEVVAEGVEDAATRQFLSQLGCDRAQGFHLGRPMPGHEVVRSTESWSRP
ncbi:MAG: EAL domain-containing protein [Chloroflexota bacterium]|nr:EAL domain-containing protein [Chloroflexota bacterium]